MSAIVEYLILSPYFIKLPLPQKFVFYQWKENKKSLRCEREGSHLKKKWLATWLQGSRTEGYGGGSGASGWLRFVSLTNVHVFGSAHTQPMSPPLEPTTSPSSTSVAPPRASTSPIFSYKRMTTDWPPPPRTCPRLLYGKRRRKSALESTLSLLPPLLRRLTPLRR